MGPKTVAVGVEYADCGGIWIRNVLVNTSEEGDFFDIQRSNCRLFLTVLALSMEPSLNQLRPKGPDGDKNADTFLVQA
jgi:hypothetical protein